MLYREIIAVCSEIHTKHVNTLCGQKVEFVNVKLVLREIKFQSDHLLHYVFRCEYRHFSCLQPSRTIDCSQNITRITHLRTVSQSSPAVNERARPM